MPFLMGVLGWLYPEGYPRIVLVIIKYIGSYVNCKKRLKPRDVKVFLL